MYIFIFILLLITLALTVSLVKTNNVPFHSLLSHHIALFALFLLFIPDALSTIAKLLGIESEMNALFFVMIGYLFFTNVTQEIRIARIRRDLEKLVRVTAIKDKEAIDKQKGQDDNN